LKLLGFPHEVKGEGIFCYVILKVGVDCCDDGGPKEQALAVRAANAVS